MRKKTYETVNQLDYLKAIYKFRFVDINLLSNYFNKHINTVYRNLEKLVDKGYITKDHISVDKIERRPASYYLAKPGITFLKQKAFGDKSAFKVQARNKAISRDYIDHCKKLASLCIELSKALNNNYNFYTRTEAKQFQNMIRPLPDIYLEPKQNKKNAWLLDIIDPGTPVFVVLKRLNAHQNHYYDRWPESMGDYPKVVFLVPDNQYKEKLAKKLNRLDWDINFSISTENQLLESFKK